MTINEEAAAAAAAAADDDEDFELLRGLSLLLLPPLEDDEPDLDDDLIALPELDNDPEELDFWKGILEEVPELEEYFPLLLLPEDGGYAPLKLCELGSFLGGWDPLEELDLTPDFELLLEPLDDEEPLLPLLEPFLF